MRRNEITDELIQLSKKAKELGFPQDVEEGDWYGYVTYTDEIFLLASNELLIGKETEETATYLVLSFSTCLAWLEQQGCTYFLDARRMNYEVFVYKYGQQIAHGKAPMRIEAITKAVIKVLEAQDE